ncbi:MAG TPA: phospholipase D-like domain-containing protein [Chitinophagaceae bacterium]|nr:phospholipase D-like domain-containing protein [Chitinophagaceae bacterium]
MRTKVISNNTLKGRAVAGTYVVMLAWDFAKPGVTQRKNLLGFAIERTEIKNNVPQEKYWMKGIKRFKDKDIGLDPGTPVPTSEHPFQSFQWCDYTAKQDKEYKYRIVPAYGTPKLIDLREKDGLVLKIRTETKMGDAATARSNNVRHDLFFNRGVIGSQAYAREFKNSIPDENEPYSKEMVWLSRGLFEALLGFISLAKNEQYSLRAALYEFHYQPVANAFAAAAESGASVKIVYDAESSYKVENLKTIERAGLDMIDAVIPRTVSEGIRHNKFIVLLENEIPVAVWTGSTNISAGGIFGHSNVGHIVWDAAIAKAYFEYWGRLSQNLTPTKLRPLNKAATPIPAGKPPKNSITPVFSARDGAEENNTLQWYADLMAGAKKLMCITVAFNLDEVFQKVIQEENNVLRYIVKDDNLGDNEIIGRDKDVLFASGGYFGKDSLFNFLRERDNPLNSNDYIHNKFMLIDPLGNDPIVVTGSANFSRPSQRINDENMLVIRGDTRIADIYFGEFMRIFDHHYARYISRKLKQANTNDPNAGYLKENDEWTRSHFDPDSYKSKRRKYFVG